MRKLENEPPDGPLAKTEYSVDFGLALVAAASPITRLVVSRIAERAGLRTHSHTPEEAWQVTPGRIPAIALLAGGTDGSDCNELLEQLIKIRHKTGPVQAPRLVMLMNKIPVHPHRSMIDAMVIMPATPDRLQPIIRDLMDHLQG